jgi:hypothetical protein
MKSHVLLIGLVFLAQGAVAQNSNSQSSSDSPSSLSSLMSGQPKYTREMVLGNILKGALENMHFTGKTIDKNLSSLNYYINANLISNSHFHLYFEVRNHF